MGGTQIVLLRGWQMNFARVQQLRQWSLGKAVRYGLSSLPPCDEVTDVVTAMVQCGAFPGQEKAYCIAQSDLDAAIQLTELFRRGLASRGAEVGGATPWRLTKLACQQLVTERQLRSSRLVSEPRPGLPLHDRSAYELCCQMLDNGWTLRRQPTKAAAALTYQQGDDKVFFTPRVTLTRSYMLALCQAERNPSMVVQHGQTADFYDKLLAGRPQRPTLALEDDNLVVDGHVQLALTSSPDRDHQDVEDPPSFDNSVEVPLDDDMDDNAMEGFVCQKDSPRNSSNANILFMRCLKLTSHHGL